MKKIISAFFLLTLLTSPGFAQCGPPHCSAVLPATPATATVRSANLGSASFRIEARLHGQNWSATSTTVNIFNVGGYHLDYGGGNGIYNAVFTGGADTASNGYGNCTVSLGSSPPPDLIFRIDRDPVNSQVRGEVFNTVTGAQVGSTCVYPVTSRATSSTIQSAGISIWGGGPTLPGGDIGFLRWYNSSVPAGTPPAMAVATPATLGDWEFNNSPIDSSGNGQGFKGITNYANKPIYDPTCLAGASQTVRLGSPLSLNGTGSSPLDGGPTLTYAWSYFAGSDGVNQNPTVTGAGTATPVVAGLNQFGSADFQLTVTDGSGNSSTCAVHDGVVSADENGVINLTSEGLDSASQKFIGPLIMYGANTWPWADTIHKTEMDVQVNNLANYYTPFWRTAMPGTISITAGSNVVTGTGTDLTAPCGSGSNPWDGTAEIILIYPGTDGVTHYIQAKVVSCTDATHLVMFFPQGSVPPYTTGPWPVGNGQAPLPNCTATCTGWGWTWGYSGGDATYTPNNQLGAWSYNAAPGNYYDNAKAFYALYWRSGIDTYLTAFQNMADWWWEFPQMDQGYSCNFNDSQCVEARSLSMNGIVLRALEEGSASPKWGGLWVVAQAAQYSMSLLAAAGNSATMDLRDTGYELAMLSYCALADPNSAHRNSCQSTLKNALPTVFTPYKRPDIGVWADLYYTNPTSVTALGGSGSVCLTKGSTTVTGSGTSWTNSLSGNEIWFFDVRGNPNLLPPGNAYGDSVGYGITITSPTSLTLTSPYAGPTACTGLSGSNRGFLMGYPEINPPGLANTTGLVGWGVQPYMAGILGTGFGFAAMAMDGYDAPSAALYRSYLDDTVQWLIQFGMDPLTGGMYYGSYHIGCVPPIPAGNVACGTTESQSQTRTLSLDVMRAFAMDYQNTSSPAVRTAADTLMSQMFSKPGTGGPNPDGFYISDFDGSYITGLPPLGAAPKWAGQLCGFAEACDMWPAVRLGAPASAKFANIVGLVAIAGKGTVP